MVEKYLRTAWVALAMVIMVPAIGRQSCGQQMPGSIPLNRANHSAVYRPYVTTSFLVGGSTDRGESAVFLPILADDRTLLFADSRGTLGDTGFQEGNWALAFRRMTDGGKIVGAWAGYDLRGTKWGHRFHQASLGVELLDHEWDFRMNGYVPFNLTPTDTPLSVGQLVVANNIVIESDRESALWGLDAEVGRRLWYRPAIVGSGSDQLAGKQHRRRGLSGIVSRLKSVEAEFRGFIGGYYFDNSTAGVTKVAGPRVRSELRLYDLTMFGNGSRLMMEGVFQKDNVRGPEFQFGCYLRVPFGALAFRRFKYLERRMVDRIIRDRDIVTTVGTVAERVQVADTGLEVDSVVRFDPETSDIAKTIRDAGPGSLVIVGNEGELYHKHTEPIELQPGQVVAGGGSEIQFRGVETGLTQSLKIPGGRPTLRPEGTTAIRATGPSQLIGLDFRTNRPLAVGIEALENAQLQIDDVNFEHLVGNTNFIVVDARDQARVVINDSELRTETFRGIGIRLNDDAQVIMENSTLHIPGRYRSIDDEPDDLYFAVGYGNGRLSISNSVITGDRYAHPRFRFFNNSQLSFDRVLFEDVRSPNMEFRDTSKLIARDLTMRYLSLSDNILVRAMDDSQVTVFDSYIDQNVKDAIAAFAFEDRARGLFGGTTFTFTYNGFAPVGSIVVQDSGVVRIADSRFSGGKGLALFDDATAVIDDSEGIIEAGGSSRMLIRDSTVGLILSGANRSHIERSTLKLAARDDAIANIVESNVEGISGRDNVELRIRNSIMGDSDLIDGPQFRAGIGMSGNSRLSIDDSIVGQANIAYADMIGDSQTTIRNSTIGYIFTIVDDNASLTYENVDQRGGDVKVNDRGYFRADSSNINGPLHLTSYRIDDMPVADIVNSRIVSEGGWNAIRLDGKGQVRLRSSMVQADSKDKDAIYISGGAILIEDSTIENQSSGAALRAVGFEGSSVIVSNSSLTSERGTGVEFDADDGETFEIRDSEIVSHGTALGVFFKQNHVLDQPASVVVEGNRLTSYNSSVSEIDVILNSQAQGNCMSIGQNVFGRGPGVIRFENYNPVVPLLVEQSRPSDNSQDINALNRVNGIPAANVVFVDGDLIFDSDCGD